ncbi:MAG: hypothetical protein ACFE68_08260 [Candidatus Hodarchaeota archaeon]
MIRINPKAPRILPSGYKDFDDYFKILSGSCTIFYVSNQTYWDAVGLLGRWASNLFDDEFNISISTRFDLITVIRMALERMPDIVERISFTAKEGKAYWIDMYSAKGLSEEMKKDFIEEYNQKLKSFGIDSLILYMVKNPEKSSSINEVNSFIKEIMGRVPKNMMGRIFVSIGDDFVDAWGMGTFLEFFKNQVDILLHKFHHTGIYSISYKNYLKKFHARIERMADNILLWGYDEEKEEKYMQILKSPIIGSFFGKVLYKMNEKMLPEFKPRKNF